MNASHCNAAFGVFAAGLVLLAVMALLPRRRVQVATNVAVALFSGFLPLQLVQSSVPSTEAVVLDSPLVGECYVYNGGCSVVLTGHTLGEKSAVDFAQFGTNGRTHFGGKDDPLTGYAGFGASLLAPTDGWIVEVIDNYAFEPPSTHGDRANAVVLDIGGDRYVVLAHLKECSVTVRVGDLVRPNILAIATECEANPGPALTREDKIISKAKARYQGNNPSFPKDRKCICSSYAGWERS